jgi:hypothetical protein
LGAQPRISPQGQGIHLLHCCQAKRLTWLSQTVEKHDTKGKKLSKTNDNKTKPTN